MEATTAAPGSGLVDGLTSSLCQGYVCAYIYIYSYYAISWQGHIHTYYNRFLLANMIARWFHMTHAILMIIIYLYIHNYTFHDIWLFLTPFPICHLLIYSHEYLSTSWLLNWGPSLDNRLIALGWTYIPWATWGNSYSSDSDPQAVGRRHGQSHQSLRVGKNIARPCLLKRNTLPFWKDYTPH